MNTISYIYQVERMDTPNFHGWVVFECVDGYEEEIFSSISLNEIKEFMRDLSA